MRSKTLRDSIISRSIGWQGSILVGMKITSETKIKDMLAAVANGSITVSDLVAELIPEQHADLRGYEPARGEGITYFEVLAALPPRPTAPVHIPAMTEAERISFERGQERALGLEEE